MMSCFIKVKNAKQLFEMLAELQSKKLVKGKDYQFTYDHDLKEVNFEFAEHRYATWFSLLWSNKT